jgi:mRNA interferase MazF
MEKDFDTWNEKKKAINASDDIKLYHEREIWWSSLGLNVGYEQDGTGKENQRPVLVLKGFSKFVCLIIPLTTSKKKNPYHVDVGMVDGKAAAAIISQLRLIDTRRLVNKVGTLDEHLFENVRNAVRGML